MYTLTHMCTCTHTCTHADTCIHRHTHIHLHAHTYRCSHTYQHSPTHTHTQTHRHQHPHTPTHAHILTLRHEHTCAHMRARQPLLPCSLPSLCGVPTADGFRQSRGDSAALLVERKEAARVSGCSRQGCCIRKLAGSQLRGTQNVPWATKKGVALCFSLCGQCVCVEGAGPGVWVMP